MAADKNMGIARRRGCRRAVNGDRGLNWSDENAIVYR